MADMERGPDELSLKTIPASDRRRNPSDSTDPNQSLLVGASDKEQKSPTRLLLPVVLVFVLFVGLVVALLVAFHVIALPEHNVNSGVPICDNTCHYQLSESIPVGMNVTTKYPSIYSEWLSLINAANYTIDIACMYMTLTKGNADPATGAQQGQDVFDALIAANKRGVSIRIASSQPQTPNVFPQEDLDYLNKTGIAEIRHVNFPMFYGSGVLHTKFILIDDKKFYVGSANMDWRSLTQVKELGFVLRHCLCFARDLANIFRIYWDFSVFSNKTEVPPNFPPLEYDTYWNASHPANMSLNGSPADAFLSVSPPIVTSKHRTSDLDAVLDIINSADETISVSVMDYLPAYEFTGAPKYWPVIDDALRSAAYDRNVTVNLLFSIWKYSFPYTVPWSKSLNAEENIHVKLMRVPFQANQTYLPYTRVQHDKYLVTEKSVWIGTSNWGADYFTTTGGVAFNSGNQGLVKDIQSLFDRDFNSQFAIPVENYSPTGAWP